MDLESCRLERTRKSQKKAQELAERNQRTANARRQIEIRNEQQAIINDHEYLNNGY